jgi:Zn-dependent membrane protease YugP
VIKSYDKSIRTLIRAISLASHRTTKAVAKQEKMKQIRFKKAAYNMVPVPHQLQQAFNVLIIIIQYGSAAN